MKTAILSGPAVTTLPSAGDTMPSPNGARSGSLWKKMTKRVPARAKAEAYQLPIDARIAVSRIGKEIQVVDPLAIFRIYSLHGFFSSEPSDSMRSKSSGRMVKTKYAMASRAMVDPAFAMMLWPTMKLSSPNHPWP